ETNAICLPSGDQTGSVLLLGPSVKVFSIFASVPFRASKTSWYIPVVLEEQRSSSGEAVGETVWDPGRTEPVWIESWSRSGEGVEGTVEGEAGSPGCSPGLCRKSPTATRAPAIRTPAAIPNQMKRGPRRPPAAFFEGHGLSPGC